MKNKIIVLITLVLLCTGCGGKKFITDKDDKIIT